MQNLNCNHHFHATLNPTTEKCLCGAISISGEKPEIVEAVSIVDPRVIAVIYGKEYPMLTKKKHIREAIKLMTGGEQT